LKAQLLQLFVMLELIARPDKQAVMIVQQGTTVFKVHQCQQRVQKARIVRLRRSSVFSALRVTTAL